MSEVVRPVEPEPLTPEQIRWVQCQIYRYLMTREEHDVVRRGEPQLNQRDPNQYRWGGERRWHGELAQLAMDVTHSSLLRRLLSGKEPLPERPWLRHSYPVYPDERVPRF